MTKAKLGNKNILILGFGREGSSIFRFLRSRFPTKKITIWDQAGREELDPAFLNLLTGDSAVKVRFGVGDWHGQNFGEYDLIIKSAGIPTKNLPTEIRERLSSETQLFFDFYPGQVIGVTGTKGKSTTSALIGAMLKSAGKKAVVAGNIGLPVLDFLSSSDQNTIFVLELSSHQLQGIKTSPHLAVITNIYPEHLDYYADFADYVQSKANITKYQTEKDYLIYNPDDLWASQIAGTSRAKKIPFGIQDKDNLNLSGGKLIGQMNQLNVQAAWSVARILGVPKDVAKEAVQNFVPLEHRLEPIGTHRGITFYDDSLATIPQATIAALDALGDRVETIFLGGFDRGVDFTDLAKRVLESKIKTVILFPTTGEKIWQKIVDWDKSGDRHFTKIDAPDMPSAVRAAFEYTHPGKIALLSCASASFSIFRDYRDRGEQFKTEILRYAKE